MNPPGRCAFASEASDLWLSEPGKYLGRCVGWCCARRRQNTEQAWRHHDVTVAFRWRSPGLL